MLKFLNKRDINAIATLPQLNPICKKCCVLKNPGVS